MHKSRLFLISLTLIAVLLMNAVTPSAVYADDGTSTDPPVEETVEVETPEDEATPETPVGEDEAVDETEPPATETTEEPVEEPGDDDSVSDPASEESTEEDVSVPEILELAPEGTELIVINEEGEVEPLVTEEAAEILETSDPIWCPASQAPTPGANGCTDSFATFAELITALASGSYSGSGTIYVEANYNGNDNSQIAFDGNVLTGLSGSGNALTIQGGWNGDQGANFDINTDITGTSLADVSMVFVNWTGDITINDFDIQNTTDGAGFGLYIDTNGAITLDNVSVNGTTSNSAGFGEGAELYSNGDVNISNSEFDDNQGNGLQVTSTGNITLTNVSAVYNTLTGAYLDSCLYENSMPGLCDGTGNVSVINSVFNNNRNGLVIDSGGAIVLNTVQANYNGLNGAYVTGADADGTGNVLVQGSNFSYNGNGAGLDIYSDGNIALSNVIAQLNNFGAILDTTPGNGSVVVNLSDFLSNDWTGLHAESGDNIVLTNVVASNNGANGAYLIADGDVEVTTSQFDDNVHFDFPQDPGLYVESKGNITLLNVDANGNEFGAGAVLTSKGTSDIFVTGGTFNTNGTFGVQAQSGDGNITITGVKASYNGVKGVYLTANAMGNVFINNGFFVENGDYGIYTQTSEGDIDLFNVTVTGNDVTDIGAFLRTQNGGNIFVDNSTFEYNKNAGLVVVASGLVNLVDVTANQNGGNGVEAYDTSTYGCRCPGNNDVVNVVVNVSGGTFTNNGSYGLMVKPGPEGDLVFVNPATFGGNGLGDYLLDLSEPVECDPCDCGDCCEPEPSKEPKIVEVPFEGGDPVEQDCENTSGTILQLPNGTWVKVGCPFEGYSTLSGITEDGLPGVLGAGADFLAGISVGLTDGEGNFVINSDGTITITFKVPEDSRGRGHSILFWDPTLDDGEGGWVQLPPFEFGTSFPLNPDNPDDGRVIISGVQEKDGFVTVTVNFPGIFILIAR